MMSIFPFLESNQGLIAVLGIFIAFIGLFLAINKKRLNRKSHNKRNSVIPPIKYNLKTIPFDILQYLSKLGYRYSFKWEETDDNRKDDLHLPFNELHHIQEYSFYCVDKYFINFSYVIASEKNLSSYGIRKSLIDGCMLHYAKGFNEGYYDYEEKVSLQKSDKYKEEMIFQRVFYTLRDGNMTIIRDGVNYNNELLLKIKQQQEEEYDKDMYSALMYLNIDAFYEVGYEGGEFYKAWEIILAAPKQFVRFFQEKEKSGIGDWFSEHPDLEMIWVNTIEKYHNKDLSRNTFDDFRFLLEMFLKFILNNNKSLEKQKETLGVFLKDNKINSHIRSSILIELNHFCKYQNNNVKHNNGFHLDDINYVYHTTLKIISCCVTAYENQELIPIRKLAE